MFLVLLAAVMALAVANGANDNFKGVATLYGSATTTYREALLLATVATAAGSAVSVLLAARLAKTFSGAGFVPPDVAATPRLLVAVGVAAAVTILLATRLGLPTSTTHALLGAVAGVALVTQGTALPWASLWTSFVRPLLLSPILAVLLAMGAYLVLRAARRRLGITSTSCACVSPTPALVHAGAGGALAARVMLPQVELGHDIKGCGAGYGGKVVGVTAQGIVDTTHRLSATAVCFARAVNDTPKIAALLLAAGTVPRGLALAPVAVAMTLGGLWGSRRVAETMSHRITDMNTGQGLTGNLVTAALVLGASHVGVPVSTTHVSCGTLFGIGAVNGRARWRTIASVGAAWLTTLPFAAALGALTWLLLARLVAA